MQKRKKIKNKQVINIDYLELSFNGIIPTTSTNQSINLNNKCYIELIKKLDSNFYNVGEIFIENRFVGIIKFNPRNGFLDENVIHFKLENSLLYHSNFTDYIEYLKSLFTYQYIIRIDVALDIVRSNILRRLNTIYKSRKTFLKGKSNETLITNQKQLLQYILGSNKSQKSLKVYNKSKELQTSGKNYIQHFWKINGIDYQNNEVERIELTLRTNHSKHIDYTQLNNSDYLSSILTTHFKNYFEFYRITNERNKQRKRNVEIFKLKPFQALYIPKHKYINQHTIKGKKTLLKHLQFENFNNRELIKRYDEKQYQYKQLDEKINSVTNLISGMVNENNELGIYYFKNCFNWKAEFQKNHSIYINNSN